MLTARSTDRLMILLLTMVLIVTMARAISYPERYSDAKFYLRAAKQMFSGQTITDTGSHPLLVPALQAGVFHALGHVDDRLSKIWFPIFYAGLLALFYFNLKRLTDPGHAALFTIFLMSFPLLLLHSQTAYCDLPLAFFYFGGVIYLYRHVTGDLPWTLFLSLAFFSLGMATKVSGVPLFLIALAVFSIYRLRWLTLALLLPAAAALPLLYSPAALIDKLHSIVLAARLYAWVPVGDFLVLLRPDSVLYLIDKRLFTYADWQLLWFAFAIFSVVFFSRLKQSPLKLLFIITTLNLAMIFLVFSSPATFPYLVDGTLVQRLIMHFSPVALFYVGAISHAKD